MGDVDRTRMILAEGSTTKVAAWKNIFRIRQNSLKKTFQTILKCIKIYDSRSLWDRNYDHFRKWLNISQRFENLK